METKPITIEIGWNAFIQLGKHCTGLKEFKKTGKYFGTQTIINKPTEAELKAELTRLKITLPK